MEERRQAFKRLGERVDRGKYLPLTAGIIMVSWPNREWRTLGGSGIQISPQRDVERISKHPKLRKQATPKSSARCRQSFNPPPCVAEQNPSETTCSAG